MELHKRSFHLLSLFVAFVAIASSTAACAKAKRKKPTPWQGKVVAVADGDTITVLRGRQRVRIRLQGVDTPEKRQAFGQQAKRFTTRFVFGKVVRVVPVTTDRYRRTVGEVFVGDRSLNEALVKAGLAWWYRRYARRAKLLEHLELEARKARRGLWADAKPVAPWDYHHRGKGLRCNVNSKVCHQPGCQYFRCRSCTARFDTRAAAKQAGYRFHRPPPKTK